MLEKPPIEDDLIRTRLAVEYGLDAAEIEFLPLGADVNTAVYRILAANGSEYFLKLRSGPFKETGVSIPSFLSSQGVSMIIPPVDTREGGGWGSLGEYRMILYPYIRGLDAYKRRLSEAQWLEFGSSLAAIHAAQLPPALEASLPREEFSPKWRESLGDFQALAKDKAFSEPVAAELAALMRSRMNQIDEVRERAEDLADLLRQRALHTVLCHSDLHPGNFLAADDGRIFIVDWDEAILAPKERDLMYIGATGHPGGEKERNLFYQGYGHADVDTATVAYYRYERIVQDLAAYCAQLLLSDEGGRDRAQGLEYFKSNFMPGGEIDIARETGR